jgi:hypothetical protein
MSEERTAVELNRDVSRRLRQVAELLLAQGATEFRVAAYRRAAESVERLGESVADVFERGGVDALRGIPGVGGTIASGIEQMLTTGRLAQLDRLRGAIEPERLFQLLPGVGPTLARRIHDALHVETLEELEMAACDGRLADVPGLGDRRAAGIRAAVAEALSRVRRPRSAADANLPEAPVELLLDVDREYRRAARAGALPTITPRRFNPTGKTQLPILHTQRGPWHLTALYSNTARAHQLSTTRDWVVIYYAEGNHGERQCTVVTETRGAMIGQRVVRGREGECRAMIASAATEPSHVLARAAAAAAPA